MKGASSTRGGKKVSSKQPKEEEVPVSLKKESELLRSKNNKRAVMPTQEDSN
jgi:hypothetical protein